MTTISKPRDECGASIQERSILQNVLSIIDGDGSQTEKLDRLRETVLSALGKPPASSVGFTVSDRHLKTLELLAQGLSNRTIARRLSMPEETVKCHVRSLLDRLNMPNRTSLALWAIREGIIPITETSPVSQLCGIHRKTVFST